MKNFEHELPSGYQQVYEIDATNLKTAVVLNVVGLAMTALAVALSVAAILSTSPFNFYSADFSAIMGALIFAAVGLWVYLVLHELTHGIVYYAMTRQKLTFGLTLPVAFCGVSNIYVYRRTALLAVLAPFVVFNLVFLAGIVILPETCMKLAAAVLFGFHFGGCVGDLYVTYLILSKIKGNFLMKDTGPKQTFYSRIT